MTQLIDAYLEQQYNNRQAVPDFADYLLDWKTRSEDFRARSNAHLNIAYGTSEREVLDIFPAEAADAPLHIFIHGGYWQALNKDSFSFMAEEFNRHGETAVILNYDLCPSVGVERIIEQIQHAILALYSARIPYPLNTRQIQISGHSAGGHLVAEMLNVDWKSRGLQQQPFKRATALSGLFDLAPLIPTSINKALQLDALQATSCSPLSKHPILDDTIELELIVGELESESYIAQSRDLALHWKESNLQIERFLAPKQNHFSLLQYFLDHKYRALL